MVEFGGSTVESLMQTRTYGKFRCHNPTCLERLTVEYGAKTVKCPRCGCEWRVAWVKEGFPRIRGPVWETNVKIMEKLAEERLGKKNR